MKKLFVLLLIILPLNLAKAEKQTTFDNDIFNKAQSDGKTVIVSSWIKYCTSCASQMKALKDVEKDFDNLIYLTFDVTNREIAKQLNIQFQTTLVIYKNNKEVYRSLVLLNLNGNNSDNLYHSKVLMYKDHILCQSHHGPILHLYHNHTNLK